MFSHLIGKTATTQIREPELRGTLRHLGLLPLPPLHRFRAEPDTDWAGWALPDFSGPNLCYVHERIRSYQLGDLILPIRSPLEGFVRTEEGPTGYWLAATLENLGFEPHHATGFGVRTWSARSQRNPVSKLYRHVYSLDVFREINDAWCDCDERFVFFSPRTISQRAEDRSIGTLLDMALTFACGGTVDAKDVYSLPSIKSL